MSSQRFGNTAMLLLLALFVLGSTGCIASSGPTLGIFGIPIPVSPLHQKKLEDRHFVKERYESIPILAPLAAGGPTKALDPPSDDEVIRALERARPMEGGIPFLYETQRNNVRIVKTKIADYIDPPRVYPLIGPAQLHHAHWKCTIYFSERKWLSYPIPHLLENEEAQEVIYIDHNHFHQVGNVNYGVDSNY